MPGDSRDDREHPCCLGGRIILRFFIRRAAARSIATGLSRISSSSALPPAVSRHCSRSLPTFLLTLPSVVGVVLHRGVGLSQNHRMVEELFKTGISQEFDKELLHRDGSSVPVHMNLFLVRSPDGSTIGMGAIIKKRSYVVEDLS
jgi:hypothetical protein